MADQWVISFVFGTRMVFPINQAMLIILVNTVFACLRSYMSHSMQRKRSNTGTDLSVDDLTRGLSRCDTNSDQCVSDTELELREISMSRKSPTSRSEQCDNGNVAVTKDDDVIERPKCPILRDLSFMNKMKERQDNAQSPVRSASESPAPSR